MLILQKTHLFNMLLSVLLLGLLFSCQATQSASNNSLMPETCTLPCWRGIKPDETLEKTFVQMAEAFPEQYSNLSIFESSNSNTYHWFDNEIKQSLSLFTKDGRVDFIRMIPRTLELEDVLDTFGPPDTYIASVTGGGGAGSLLIIFFYEELGIIVEEFLLPYVPSEEEVASCSINISLDLSIGAVYYTVPDSPEKMAEAVQTRIFDQPKAWQEAGQTALTSCKYGSG